LVLTELVRQFETKFYDKAEGIVMQAREACLTMADEDKQNLVTVYGNLCLNLLSEIQHLINVRREQTIPYIKELVGKVAQNHDCLNCDSSCKGVGQSLIREIETAHYKIRDIFCRLLKLAPLVYSEDVLPPAYILVRKEMAALNILIFELFYLEETSLIPSILEAKRKINAHS